MMGIATLFPLLLMVLAAAWIGQHVRAWRATQDSERDPAELDFQWRRFRRRMQASTLLAVAALGMLAGLLIPQREHPELFVWCWSGVVVLTVWLLLLALADALATRSHVARLRRVHRVERAKLEAEAARLREQAKAGEGKGGKRV